MHTLLHLVPQGGVATARRQVTCACFGLAVLAAACLGLAGCREQPVEKAELTLAQVLESAQIVLVNGGANIGVEVFCRGVVPGAQEDVRAFLQRQGPDESLAAIGEAFSRAANKNEEDRARFLALLLLVDLEKSRDPQAARQIVRGLAARGMADSSFVVSLVGARVLERVAPRSEEDKKLILERLKSPASEQLASVLYDVLWRWGARDEIRKRVLLPYPAEQGGAPTPAERIVLARAIQACRHAEWRAPNTPEKLSVRLVDLMQTDPELVSYAADCLVYLDAREAVPRMKAVAQTMKGEGGRRVLEASILRLDSGAPDRASKAVQVVAEHVRAYGAWHGGQAPIDASREMREQVRWGVQAAEILTDVAFLATENNDTGLLREVLHEYEAIPVQEQSSTLELVLMNLEWSDLLFMKCLADRSDAQLAALFKANPGLWSRVNANLGYWSEKNAKIAPAKPGEAKDREAIAKKMLTAHAKAVQ